MVKRFFLDVRAVLEKRWKVFVGALGKVLAEDDDGHAGGAEIFLCAGKDEAELLYFDGFRGDVGRHVGNEWDVARIRHCGPLRAFNGVVCAEIDVGGIRGKMDFARLRQTRESL